MCVINRHPSHTLYGVILMCERLCVSVVLQDTDKNMNYIRLAKYFGITKATATKWYEEIKSHLGVVSGGQ